MLLCFYAKKLIFAGAVTACFGVSSMLLKSYLGQIFLVLPVEIKRVKIYGNAVGNLIAVLLFLSLSMFCDEPFSQILYCTTQIPMLIVALIALRAINSNKTASDF